MKPIFQAIKVSSFRWFEKKTSTANQSCRCILVGGLDRPTWPKKKWFAVGAKLDHLQVKGEHFIEPGDKLHLKSPMASTANFGCIYYVLTVHFLIL